MLLYALMKSSITKLWPIFPHLFNFYPKYQRCSHEIYKYLVIVGKMSKPKDINDRSEYFYMMLL